MINFKIAKTNTPIHMISNMSLGPRLGVGSRPKQHECHCCVARSCLFFLDTMLINMACNILHLEVTNPTL